MEFTSLWDEASRDLEAESRERVAVLASQASAGIWQFLAAAKSEPEFETRLALAESQISTVAAETGAEVEDITDTMRRRYALLVEASQDDGDDDDDDSDSDDDDSGDDGDSDDDDSDDSDDDGASEDKDEDGVDDSEDSDGGTQFDPDNDGDDDSSDEGDTDDDGGNPFAKSSAKNEGWVDPHAKVYPAGSKVFVPHFMGDEELDGQKGFHAEVISPPGEHGYADRSEEHLMKPLRADGSDDPDGNRFFQHFGSKTANYPWYSENHHLSADCKPGGSGQCDGYDYDNGNMSCDCHCHTTSDLPQTIEGVKDWHDDYHGIEKESGLDRHALLLAQIEAGFLPTSPEFGKEAWAKAIQVAAPVVMDMAKGHMDKKKEEAPAAAPAQPENGGIPANPMDATKNLKEKGKAILGEVLSSRHEALLAEIEAGVDPLSPEFGKTAGPAAVLPLLLRAAPMAAGMMGGGKSEGAEDEDGEPEGVLEEGAESSRLPFVSEGAKSDTCPRCGDHMSDVTVNGDTLKASCGGCGWSGSKTKKTSARDWNGETTPTEFCNELKKYDDLWNTGGREHDSSCPVHGGPNADAAFSSWKDHVSKQSSKTASEDEPGDNEYGGRFRQPESLDIPNQYGHIQFHTPKHVDPDHSPDAGQVHITDPKGMRNGKHNVMVIDANGNSQWPIRYDHGGLGFDNPHSIVTPHDVIHKALDHAEELDRNLGTTSALQAEALGSQCPKCGSDKALVAVPGPEDGQGGPKWVCQAEGCGWTGGKTAGASADLGATTNTGGIPQQPTGFGGVPPQQATTKPRQSPGGMPVAGPGGHVGPAGPAGPGAPSSDSAPPPADFNPSANGGDVKQGNDDMPGGDLPGSFDKGASLMDRLRERHPEMDDESLSRVASLISEAAPLPLNYQNPRTPNTSNWTKNLSRAMQNARPDVSDKVEDKIKSRVQPQIDKGKKVVDNKKKQLVQQVKDKVLPTEAPGYDYDPSDAPEPVDLTGFDTPTPGMRPGPKHRGDTVSPSSGPGRHRASLDLDDYPLLLG